jgi:undecaprenyl-diphosphatase
MIRWEGMRREARWLVGLLAVAVALLAAALLTDAAMHRGAHGFDHAVLRALGDLRSPRLVDAARDITALGSTVVLTGVTLGVMGYLALARQPGAALLVALSVGGGSVIVALVKAVVDRARPDLVPAMVEVSTASFPSGHAMLSAVAWLTLGALLMRVQPRRRLRAYILSLAVAITVLVGLSRLVLGVHWPTDVLAGWCLGAAWALLCWMVALRLQRAGQVESPSQPVTPPPAPPRPAFRAAPTPHEDA